MYFVHDSYANDMMGHQAVMMDVVTRLLGAENGGYFIDGTFGGGGHSEAILNAHPENRVLAFDRDPDAVQRSVSLSDKYKGRFVCEHAAFSSMHEFVNTSEADGILLDLGVSSFQLDTPERGFAFRYAAPLDMRMDPSMGESASVFLEHASRDELVQAIRDYGEERSWRRIVDLIMEARGSGILAYTDKLAELVAKVVKPDPRKRRVHPATKVFQGIRIAVNDELGELERVLPSAMECLKPGGLLVVISFHSLEDRIVKRFFKRMAGRPEHGKDSRSQHDRTQSAKLMTNRPVVADDIEITMNPRARSAKVRALQKLKNDEQ